MLNKILIANRGEIACRVMRTAQAKGIYCIAIYSAADRHALHAEMADEAHYIGGAASQDSYLQAQKIIDIAKQSGAQAIHPGYGFLAENAAFAQLCADNNIIFIGPSASAIIAMGSKSAAKNLMQQAQVPVTPGYHGDEQTLNSMQQAADKIGYPVLLKASAGGGGKGMKLVEHTQQFAEAYQAAKREAKSSFNDDHLLIEKYIAEPRHIEVQIFCDQFGNGIYLFERDCSIQRRHQKIIEEAPAIGLSDSLRQQIGETAVKAALAINYCGAGTIEFLLDKNHQFYFMEMNTRLQVEHPVTEKITGLDLVDWQLQIADGQALPLKQQDLAIKGHAIEVRIYAEDPQKNFLPSIGKIIYYQPPRTSDTVRIDSGIRQGDDISMYYDPMIAKLIVWGNDRIEAIQHMRQALRHYQIAGVTTNITFLQQIFANDDYQQGKLSTHFIDQHPQLFSEKRFCHDDFAYACVYELTEQQQIKIANSHDIYSPWQQRDAWQLSGKQQQTLNFYYQNESYPIIVEHSDDRYLLTFPDQHQCQIKLLKQQQHHYQIQLNDRQCSVDIISIDNAIHIFSTGEQNIIHRYSRQKHYAQTETSGGHLNAPMPGTVVAIMTEKGKSVAAGDSLMVIEAMKMEHTIHAPAKGIIKALHYAIGDQVNEGAELMDFEVL